MICCNKKCAREYSLPVRFQKSLVGKQFCSPDCMIEYIKHLEPLSQYPIEWEGATCDLPITSSFCASYSVRLGRCFRSEYEAIVAEVMIHYGLDFVYEGVVCRVGGKDKLYYPDLLETTHGCLLEVKGSFSVGGKSKFQDALQTLGDERLLLIGPQYYSAFRSAVIRIRRM